EDGPLLAFEDSCEYLRSGSYTCKPPADCWLLLDYLGKYRLVDACWHVDLEDRILEGRDLVGRLSGKRGVVSLCLAALEVYLGNPNHENREALRLAYEAVPRHNRRYCGDMDTKDIPIRMILYGQQEIESWSHRIASRQRGMSLPEISVPLVEGPDR
ncbi:MAG: hypothetical protein J0I12_16325, partial [Candidatus Eremiobacteraeota bacterium]|nr:hypothetical protein [Candidatus Eremiobacteraeota bacterium]